MSRKKKPVKMAKHGVRITVPLKPVAEQHADLIPKTLTGLKDALSLNGIRLKWHMEDQYTAVCETDKMKREINPYMPAEILKFFKDALCHH